MASKLLGNLRVRLTAETEDFRRGLASARKNLNTFEKDIQRFRRNTMAQVLAISTLTAVLGSSISVANEYERANSQLAATAKLTGTELGFLQSVSKSAQEQFKLSTVAANGLTIELTKLATKAGDASQASAGLAAFLDIGAARGLDASQTLQAVRQAILGIDEGTDKLFGKNPSAIYKEFADSIGTTVGRLSDQQKAQALLNAAMQDGAKVRGEYQRWLRSSQGQQYLLSQSIEKTQAALGEALKPALVAIIPVIITLVGWVQKAIQGVQMLGASLAFIPALWNAGILALQGNFQAARQELQHQLTAWRETIEEIKNASNAADFVPSLLPTSTGSQANEEASEAGRATARSYFDGLKEEWEQLRYTVALRSISLTGTDEQRRALEEEHQLRLLAIEAERLTAMRNAGELTTAEWLESMKVLDARRELVKARRRELDAVDEQLAKQRNLMDLTESVGSLLRSKASGPGTGIGTNAAKVLDDKFNISDKIGEKLGATLGGVAGNFLLPGIGGMVGGFLGNSLGKLFGRDEKRKEQESPVVTQLQAIERAQKETITAIKGQTEALLKPENRVINLPSSFNVPAYRPAIRGGGSTTNITYGDTHVTVNFEVTSEHSPEDIRRIAMEGVADALARDRRNMSRSVSRF